MITQAARACFDGNLVVEVVSASPRSDEEQLRREVQRQLAPTRREELERRAQANPALGQLLEGLGGEVVDDD
jgi:hypothetical protein